MIDVSLESNISIVNGLRNRYDDIHPLAFHRSLERANSVGELFDILDTFPKMYPIVWDEKLRRWMHTEDATLSDQFDFQVAAKKRRRKK